MKTASKSELFRKLPSVDELLRAPDLAPLLAQAGRSAVTDAARSVLDRLRKEISSGNLKPSAVDAALAGLTDATERQLRRATAFSLRPVINATGVILHTNLGRAPLAQNALDHVREISQGYSNLEFDLESGARGERDLHVDRLFRKLLQGAEANLSLIHI